ncbi:MAG: hypothetical protein HGA85_05115 [Nanoarchaeota archaeon]|nr:hypothetical protein [Nanoarchaeota archaeon]
MPTFEYLKEQAETYMQKGEFMMAQASLNLMWMEAGKDNMKKQAVHTLVGDIHVGLARQDILNLEARMSNALRDIGQRVQDTKEAYLFFFSDSAKEAMRHLQVIGPNMSAFLDYIDLTEKDIYSSLRKSIRTYAFAREGFSERHHELKSKEAYARSVRAEFKFFTGKREDALTEARKAEELICLSDTHESVYVNYTIGLILLEQHSPLALSYIAKARDAAPRFKQINSREIAIVDGLYHRAIAQYS